MLYLIGLGLDWKDISLKSLEAISKCDEVYLEHYTSTVPFSDLQLERLLGKKVTSLNRKQVEEERPFLNNSIKDIALLIYGDPLIATTHIEILQECKKKNIRTEVIHAPSILNAVAETGLQIYKFGKIGSIPFWRTNYQPESFINILKDNQKINAHTLYLLDLEGDKFLTIKQAIEQLLNIKDESFTEDTLCVGCSKLGTSDKKIIVAKAKDLLKVNFGPPPYCLIIPSELHFAEEEYLRGIK